jgi:hypothetical protein
MPPPAVTAVTAVLSRRDAFQLAYLPHVVATHFNTLLLLDQAGQKASPKLSEGINRALSALPKRGPEVQSCVLQIERILASHGAVPPPAPKLPEEAHPWSDKVATFVREALDPRRWDSLARDQVDPSALLADGANLLIYTLAQRVGDAEQTLRLSALTERLLAEEPTNALLLAQKQRLEADRVRGRERLDGVQRDLGGAGEKLGRLTASAVGRVIHALVANPTSARDFDLTVGVVSEAAELLERSVVARAFPELVREAKNGVIPAQALERALLECPTVRVSRQEATLWVATDGDGAADECLLRGQDDLEWIVVDAATPETCVHFSAEHLPRLRLLAEAVSTERAAVAWSGVSFDRLVKYPFYRVLVRGESMRNLVWTDHAGRPFIAVFTADDALEAFLAQVPPLGEAVERRWMPGGVLFPALSRADLGGFVLNPAGPGPSRIFNRGTLGALGST